VRVVDRRLEKGDCLFQAKQAIPSRASIVLYENAQPDAFPDRAHMVHVRLNIHIQMENPSRDPTHLVDLEPNLRPLHNK
jgi:hypothetical protein